MPGAGRGPRRISRSSNRARSRRSAGAMPRAAIGCLSNASNGTGARPSAKASARRRKNTMGPVSFNGVPAESSISTSQRDSSAATRRARLRSGVIRAAVLPGVSSTSRNRRAMAVASSRGELAWMKCMPSSALSAIGFRATTLCCHWSVVSAGRMSSERMVSRAWSRAPSGVFGSI